MKGECVWMATQTDTREIAERYIESSKKAYLKKSRGKIIRPEVFQHEEKLGKSIFEMNSDELLQLLDTFPEWKTHNPSTAAVSNVKSIYCGLFDYYTRTVRPIVNHWRDEELEAPNIIAYLSKGKKPLDFPALQRAIKRAYDGFAGEVERGRYIECITLVYYCGIHGSRELMSIKEDMIDFDKHEIHIDGRTVKLSNRCFDLLQYVHGLTGLKAYRFDSALLSWRGSYFKCICRMSSAASFESRPIEMITSNMDSYLMRYLLDDDGVPINYRSIYLVGLYDRLCEAFGKEDFNAYLRGEGRPASMKEMSEVIAKYSNTSRDPSYFRRALIPYITD